MKQPSHLAMTKPQRNELSSLGLVSYLRRSDEFALPRPGNVGKLEKTVTRIRRFLVEQMWRIVVELSIIEMFNQFLFPPLLILVNQWEIVYKWKLLQRALQIKSR